VTPLGAYRSREELGLSAGDSGSEKTNKEGPGITKPFFIG